MKKDSIKHDSNKKITYGALNDSNCVYYAEVTSWIQNIGNDDIDAESLKKEINTQIRSGIIKNRSTIGQSIIETKVSPMIKIPGRTCFFSSKIFIRDKSGRSDIAIGNVYDILSMAFDKTIINNKCLLSRYNKKTKKESV